MEKELHWLKAQVSSLEKGIEMLNIKLKFAEAENEHNKEMLKNNLLAEHEAAKNKDY